MKNHCESGPVSIPSIYHSQGKVNWTFYSIKLNLLKY